MRKGRKDQGQFHRRPNIALRLAAILLMLVCLSVWMMNGLFAKYRTSDEGGDNARVMKFGQLFLIESGQFNLGKGMLIPGVSLEKDVWINFTGSEAATYVFVEAELSGHWTRTTTTSNNTETTTFKALGDKISWSVVNGWKYLEIPVVVPPATDTEGNDGTDGAGESTGTDGTTGTQQVPSPFVCVFYIKLDPNATLAKDFINGPSTSNDIKGTITVSDRITRTEIKQMTDATYPLSISLRAVAVQGNGFSTALEAWQSVSGTLD